MPLNIHITHYTAAAATALIPRRNRKQFLFYDRISVDDVVVVVAADVVIVVIVLFSFFKHFPLLEMQRMNMNKITHNRMFASYIHVFMYTHSLLSGCSLFGGFCETKMP